MMKYDAEILSSDNMSAEYKPYFAWFRFKVQLTEADLYQERIGTWTKAEFSKEKDDGTIEGFYEYSASPIKSIYALIRLNPGKLPQTIINNIVRCYPCPQAGTDSAINNQLQTLFQNVRLTKSRIYKVGNGNLISLLGKKQLPGKKKDDPFTVLFDIGYHREGGPRKQYNPAVLALKYIQPSVVLISHWDFDHYKGVIYASDDIFKCPWFAPELDGKDGVNARRLVSYIHRRSMFTKGQSDARLISKGNSEFLLFQGTSNSNISLYKGSGTGDSNKRNSQGLVLSVSNKNNSGNIINSVFHGDVPYEAVPGLVWGVNSYDYLIVPHHGTRLGSYQELNQCVGGSAVICCVNDSKIDRPNTDHVVELQNKGYKVYVTEGVCTYYEIDLESKGIVPH